ncbi:MAG: hypothetical protein ACXWNK_16000 [Vulcanimicrobiaceae bacterium]
MSSFRTAGFLLLLAMLVAGCGDTGDHFLEFRKNAAPATSSPTLPSTVAKIVLSMPSYSLVRTQGGSYPLGITTYDAKGNLIPIGARFTYPVSISSDSSGYIAFTNAAGGNSSTTISVPDTMTQVYVTYDPCESTTTQPCTGDSQNINLMAISAGATSASLTLATVVPTVSNGPPPVTEIALAVLGPMRAPGTAGTYPLQITARSNGAQIPLGSAFLYPISLTSNDSCEVSFGTNPAITSYNTSTFSVPNSMTQVYVSYNPGLTAQTPCVVPPPPQIVITATDQSAASPATLTF